MYSDLKKEPTVVYNAFTGRVCVTGVKYVH